MVCRLCGYQNSNDSKYCAGCASKLGPQKNRIVILLGCVLAVMLVLVCFLSRKCNHEWVNADCTTAKICLHCDEVVGEPLGHTWIAATCTQGKICSSCGRVEGAASGHEWGVATCTEPEVCGICGQTQGAPKGHIWLEANCTDPYICSVCGVSEGEAVGHYWILTMDQYGVEGKQCVLCGEYQPAALEWTPITHCERIYVSDEEGLHKKDVVVGDWQTRIGTLPEAIRFWVSNKEGNSNTEHCVYRISGDFDTLSGLISIDEKTEQFATMQIKIYLDNELAFESITLSESSKDDSFTLDVTGVDLVHITCTTTTVPSAYCVVSAALY